MVNLQAYVRFLKYKVNTKVIIMFPYSKSEFKLFLKMENLKKKKYDIWPSILNHSTLIIRSIEKALKSQKIAMGPYSDITRIWNPGEIGLVIILIFLLWLMI